MAEKTDNHRNIELSPQHVGAIMASLHHSQERMREGSAEPILHGHDIDGTINLLSGQTGAGEEMDIVPTHQNNRVTGNLTLRHHQEHDEGDAG